MLSEKYRYNVTFSFAEEDDAFVREVADYLKQKDSDYYYYKEDLVQTWGKDLKKYISSIYQRQSRLCVVVVSEAYLKKEWTRFELAKAQMKAKKALQEYILPFKMDDSQLPGVPSTIKYLSYNDFDAKKLADAICMKIDEHKKRDTFYARLHGRFLYYGTSPRHLSAFAIITILMGWLILRDHLTPISELSGRLYERNTERVRGSRCKDGRFSESRGRGSCSYHGGVLDDADTLIPHKTMEECRKIARRLSWVGD